MRTGFGRLLCEVEDAKRMSRMNFRTTVHVERFLPLAPFFGAVFVGVALGGFAYYLTYDRVPPPSTPLSIYLSVCFWAFMLYVAFQFRNLLRAWMIVMLADQVFAWIWNSYGGLSVWFVHNALTLFGGVLLVTAGAKARSARTRIAVFLLLVGVSIFRYFTIVNWARILEKMGG
jgi:hypothetical protein